MNAKAKLIAIIIVLLFIQIAFIPVVQAISNKPVVLVIDPGHGGKMTGAVNNKLGIVERDVTLKIAKYLRDYLNQYENIKVIMTHEGLPSDVEMELVSRGMVARNNNADMLISLHLNDYSTPGESGAEVYVTNNRLLPKYNENSTKFGNIVLNKLSKLGITKRGVKTRLCNDRGPKWEYSDGSIADYYGVIRYPMKGDSEDRGANLANGEGIPGVIIEHCFINDGDSRFVDSEQDIQRLARADCEAIVEYYGLEKKDITRVSAVSLNKQNVTLIKNEKTKLVATVTPDTAKNKNVKWTSSNNNVATVTNTGEVTAVGVGTATITVTTEDRNRTATATINVRDVEVIPDRKEVNLIEGNKAKIEYTVTPDSVVNKAVTWKSNNEEIAKVDENGIITAIKEGKTTITVTTKQNNKTATINVNVHKLGENQKIKINNLKQENGRLSKIQERTIMSEFKKNFEISNDLEIIIQSENKVLLDKDYVGTGAKVQIREKASNIVLQEYICVIYGDVNGDGKISAMDYTLIENHIMEIQPIVSPYKKITANVNNDKRISAMDYTLIENHIMNIKKIEAR